MALERLIDGKIVSLQANFPHYLHNQTVVSLLCMLKKNKKAPLDLQATQGVTLYR